MFRHRREEQLIAAISRLAAGVEEANRLTRLQLGVPDPGAAAPDWDLDPSVTTATDAESFDHEQEQRRIDRDR